MLLSYPRICLQLLQFVTICYNKSKFKSYFFVTNIIGSFHISVWMYVILPIRSWKTIREGIVRFSTKQGPHQTTTYHSVSFYNISFYNLLFYHLIDLEVIDVLRNKFNFIQNAHPRSRNPVKLQILVLIMTSEVVYLLNVELDRLIILLFFSFFVFFVFFVVFFYLHNNNNIL